mmetsp:Transcript_20757/g.63131  ORF Transcript_20757/g.63131 Transcript_20757/m.63131 type:complete len:268 (-) Transcript_20757:274-1077(-)
MPRSTPSCFAHPRTPRRADSCAAATGCRPAFTSHPRRPLHPCSLLHTGVNPMRRISEGGSGVVRCEQSQERTSPLHSSSWSPAKRTVAYEPRPGLPTMSTRVPFPWGPRGNSGGLPAAASVTHQAHPASPPAPRSCQWSDHPSPPLGCRVGDALVRYAGSKPGRAPSMLGGLVPDDENAPGAPAARRARAERRRRAPRAAPSSWRGPAKRVRAVRGQGKEAPVRAWSLAVVRTLPGCPFCISSTPFTSEQRASPWRLTKRPTSAASA